MAASGTRSRMTRSGEIETRQFYVPELRFPWAVPELLFADSMQLEAAARESLAAVPVLQAIAATPEPVDQEESDEAKQLTREDVLHLIITARTVEAVRALWVDARTAGCLDKAMRRLLADRATELKRLEDQEVKTRRPENITPEEIIDAEIIDD